MARKLSTLPAGVRLGVAPLSWVNDVLEDLGADIPLETCLAEAAQAGYEGIELGRKFPREARVLSPCCSARNSYAKAWLNQLGENPTASARSVFRKRRPGSASTSFASRRICAGVSPPFAAGFSGATCGGSSMAATSAIARLSETSG